MATTVVKKNSNVIAIETGEFTTIHKETRFCANARDEYELVINNPAKVVEFPETTIDDMLSKARAEGQAEGYALARKIAMPHGCGGYSYAECVNIFGTCDIGGIFEKLPSFAEAQAKVIAYEQKFRPGDIVINKLGGKAIVTCAMDDGFYALYPDGSCSCQGAAYSFLGWKKTGKHIDLDEFFEAIKGKKESGNE